MKPDISSYSQQTPKPSFAIQIVPPLHSNTEHAIALEATMQSLVLDRRHPIALELAGTVQRRRFIVRATTQMALDHVESLLHAQYPQSEIRPLPADDDPFRLDPGEAITAVELVAGSAAFLPLRTWQEAQKEGTDPLLSLLGALGHLPEDTRIVAQLGLVPAASNWSHQNLRRAIESPLEPERRQETRRNITALVTGDVVSTYFSNVIIANVGIFAGLLFLLRAYIPSWVAGAITKIIIGQGSRVPASQTSLLILFAGALILLEGLFVLLYLGTRAAFRNRALYDPKVVASKISRMAYHTRLRLYVIGPKESKNTQSVVQRFADERAQAGIREELMLRMVAAYRQFDMANGAFFVPKRISSLEVERLLSVNMMGNAGWQHGLRNSRHLISVDSLATLWHMPPPQALPELALVEHRRARTLLIPPAVTRQCEHLPPIGYSEHAGYRLPFALTKEFFNFHTLIGGKAGEGKSVMIQHIAQEAMRLGGLVLIDPFGDLCEKVLELVPANRSEDVVFIDLSDTLVSVGLNPLDVTLGHRRDKFIADLLKMLAQIWASSWTAKMENAFEMTLRTLFEANKILVAQDPKQGPSEQYTLLDILPLLTNANFCQTLLQQIEDDYLHRWWSEYYEPLSLVQQRDVINPIAAKVAKFESLVARRILGQGVSTLNIPQMIQERKIILFKLARGVVGNEVASMIGATLLGLIQNTLEEHQEHMNTTRLPIIIDEFQRVAGADYRTLSELHKYGATFFLSTQSLEYIQKINPLLWPTLQANVRQIIAFNMASPDATMLSRELGVDQDDILYLDINTCYVSVLAAGTRQPTFSLKLSPTAITNAAQTESIRTRCRIRYTCSIAEVDERLREAMLRSIRLVPQPGAHPSSTLVLPQEKETDPTPFVEDERWPEEQAQLEGAEYRNQRERHRDSDPSRRLERYRAERDEWNDSDEALHEGAEYRRRRERPSDKDASQRLEHYKQQKDEWSNPEDSFYMDEEDSLEAPSAKFGTQEEPSAEMLEEMELMELNSYNMDEEIQSEQDEAHEPKKPVLYDQS